LKNKKKKKNKKSLKKKKNNKSLKKIKCATIFEAKLKQKQNKKRKIK